MSSTIYSSKFHSDESKCKQIKDNRVSAIIEEAFTSQLYSGNIKL